MSKKVEWTENMIADYVSVDELQDVEAPDGKKYRAIESKECENCVFKNTTKPCLPCGVGDTIVIEGQVYRLETGLEWEEIKMMKYLVSEDYQQNVSTMQIMFDDLCKKHKIKTKFVAEAELPSDGMGDIYIHPSEAGPGNEKPYFMILGNRDEIISCEGLDKDAKVYYPEHCALAYCAADGDTEDVFKTEEEIVQCLKQFDN